MDPIILIIRIAILLISVVIHEVSHGAMANYLGDPTAKYAGRLTLNPIKHLDVFGAIIMPLFTYLVWGFPLGAAKPVPYNPYNLKNKKWGPGLVAAAGPGSNLIIALTFGLALRFIPPTQSFYLQNLAQVFIYIVFLNLLLAAFNLIPIPPLDGSKIVFAFFPTKIKSRFLAFGSQFKIFFAKYWIILLLFLFLFFRPILVFVFNIIILILGS